MTLARAVLAALLALSCAARTLAQTRLELVPATSRLSFQASATMGDFSGRAPAVRGWTEFGAADYTDARGQVELDVASLQTGIGLRDRHLRETLEATTFPTITFALDSVRPVAGDTVTPYRLHGRLVVRSVEKQLVVFARIATAGDALRVTGSFPLRFTELGIKPPSRLLGTAKVKDEFVAGLDLVFRPAGGGGGVGQPQS